MNMLRLMLAVCLVGSNAFAGEWERLPTLPDKDGFAGSFAGVSDNALIVAGGANFPDKKPWEGGKKIWHDTVFVLETPKGEWKVAGKLPRPLAYGVSVTHGGGVVCVGGSDTDRHYADCFRLDWKDGKLVTTKLPSLPEPVANACGALVGDTLYVAGGHEKPDSKTALKAVWTIDLASKSPEWKASAPLTAAGRILAVAASHDGCFWMVGGAELFPGKDDKAERRYLKDGYRYHPDTGWKQIADLPRAVVAAPSPAPTDATGFHILGGDDGSQLTVAPDKHVGFSRKILRYDSKTGKWSETGGIDAPRVTVPCVPWNKAWVIPSGESKPGVRSPEVFQFIPGGQVHKTP